MKRQGEAGASGTERTCSVTSNETFILALLALLCSSDRLRVRYVRIESCTLSYFSHETVSRLAWLLLQSLVECVQ